MYLYCFCSRCRKKSGSAHSANLFLDRKHFRWLTGEDKITTYELPDVARLANCFCSTCGSRMPRIMDELVSIPAGSLDKDPAVMPDKCIHWDSHAGWLPSRERLPKVAET